MITMQKACEVLKEKYPRFSESMKGIQCVEYNKGFLFIVGQLGFTPFVSKQMGTVVSADSLEVMLDWATGDSINSVVFD